MEQDWLIFSEKYKRYGLQNQTVLNFIAEKKFNLKILDFIKKQVLEFERKNPQAIPKIETKTQTPSNISTAKPPQVLPFDKPAFALEKDEKGLFKLTDELLLIEDEAKILYGDIQTYYHDFASACIFYHQNSLKMSELEKQEAKAKIKKCKDIYDESLNQVYCFWNEIDYFRKFGVRKSYIINLQAVRSNSLLLRYTDDYISVAPDLELSQAARNFRGYYKRKMYRTNQANMTLLKITLEKIKKEIERRLISQKIKLPNPNQHTYANVV